MTTARAQPAAPVDPLDFAHLAEERHWTLLELYGLDDPGDLIEHPPKSGNWIPNPKPDGKRPRGAKWEEAGTLAAIGRVTTWRERGSNVGLLPAVSGLVVLDVEPAGLATWPREKIQPGALVIGTPSGGFHLYLYLAAVERVLGVKLTSKLTAPGAELISHGGQVVVPPSRARSRKVEPPRVGAYTVEQIGEPIADEAVLAALLEPFRAAAVRKNGKHEGVPAPLAPSGTTTTYGRKLLDAELRRIGSAANGTRHTTFIRRASRVFAYVAGGEIEEREAEECLRAAYTSAMPDELHNLERDLRDARGYGFADPKMSKKRRLALEFGDCPTPKLEPAPPEEADSKPPKGAIWIADGQLHEIVPTLIAVLARSGRVYRRGEVLVIPSRVERETRAKPGHPRRSRGALHAPLASEHALVEIAMNRIPFVRQNLKEERGWKFTDLPAKYAAHVLARKGDWPGMPDLAGLAESPILRPDGTVASVGGYDELSGYLLGLSREFPAVPEHPTEAQARAALALLLEPLAEFPFTTEAARSVALSAMLSPLARPAIRTVPGHAFDAPIMASGKTLLADLPALLATGRCAAANQVPREEEEFRKMLLALAIESDLIVVFDNAEHAIRSAALSSAMTAHQGVRGRVLGLTANASAPWTACVFVTGNNLALAGDLATRFLRCRIDPRCENPEERDEFRIGDLRAWTLDHRAELVGAALALLRWGVLLQERPKLRRFGRFEDYDRIVRAPLVALGCADPGDTRAELRTEDPVRERRRTLLRKLADAFPDGREFEFDDAAQALAPAAVLGHVEMRPRERLRDNDLRDLRGKVFDGRTLVRVGEDRKGYSRWRVEVLQ